MLGGSLSPQYGASSGCGWRNGLQLWRLAANIANKQSKTNDKKWSSSLGGGRGANDLIPYKINLLRKLLKSFGLDVSSNGGEEERTEVTGGRDRRKETIRKTKT
jgi:hypothetical protein